MCQSQFKYFKGRRPLHLILVQEQTVPGCCIRYTGGPYLSPRTVLR